MKCFCGKEATFHVFVEGEGDSKFLDCPRCDDCKERAVRSYERVYASPIKENENGTCKPDDLS